MDDLIIMQNRVYIPPPEKILELVKELAIPKKNKSGGSKSTQIKIFKKLKKLGFPFTVENFNLISPKYGKNLFLILLGFFSILSVILLYFSQFSATLIIFFLIFMAYIFYKRISNDLTYQIVQELFMKKNKIHKIIKNEDRDGVEDKIHTFTKDEKN